MKIKFKNFLGTIESFFRTDATAPRTYQFQDRDGTIIDDTDFSVIAWDMTGNTVPTTGKNGQKYHGTGITTLTTSSGNPIPTDVLFTQISIPANSVDTSAFIFQYII